MKSFTPMITCLLAAPAFAPLDAATPYRFNHDETKVGTCTLPDERQCVDGTPVPDHAAWQAKRRGESVIFTHQHFP